MKDLKQEALHWVEQYGQAIVAAILDQQKADDKKLKRRLASESGYCYAVFDLESLLPKNAYAVCGSVEVPGEYYYRRFRNPTHQLVHNYVLFEDEQIEDQVIVDPTFAQFIHFGDQKHHPGKSVELAKQMMPEAIHRLNDEVHVLIERPDSIKHRMRIEYL